MNLAQQFETGNDLMPTHAAKMLGVSYSLWKKLRTGEKSLQPYHIASIEAHQQLSKVKFKELLKQRI